MDGGGAGNEREDGRLSADDNPEQEKENKKELSVMSSENESAVRMITCRTIILLSTASFVISI